MKKAPAILLSFILAVCTVLLTACGSREEGENGSQATEATRESLDPYILDAVTADYTVKFKNSLGWDGTIYVYYWSDARQKMVEWPGKPMTDEGDGVYAYTLPAEAEYIIFTNGGDQPDTQTRDIPFDGTQNEFMAAKKTDRDGAHYVTDWAGAAVVTNDLYGSEIDPDKIVYTDDLKLEVTDSGLVKNYSSGFSSVFQADAFVLTLKNDNPYDVVDVTVYLMAYDTEGNCAFMTKQKYLKKVSNPAQFVEVTQTYDRTVGAGKSEEFAYRCDLDRIQRVETLVYSYASDGKRYTLPDETRDAWIKKVTKQ